MRQLSLVDPIDQSRSAARAEALEASKRRGGRLADCAGDKAGGEWVEAAVASLRVLAVAAYPGMFSIEQARLVIHQSLQRPHDLRAWGRVTQLSVRRGFIARVKGKTLPAASSHGSEKPCFTKGPNA
jgi:hypothetical protein